MKINVQQESYLDRGGNPTIRELLQKLVFNPVDGTIKLNDRRLILQRSSFGSHLRDELIRACGKMEAFVILTRLGYKAGMEDAAFLRKAWPSLDLGDAFTAGTRLHTLRGMVRVETVHNDFDFKRGKFSGEFLWHDSVEAFEFCQHHGQSHEPICWSQVGYASGYATYFFEKPIVYKEVQCIARGDRACRVVGKPIDMWGDEHLVELYRKHILTDAPVSASHAAAKPAVDSGTPPPASLKSLLLAPVISRLDKIARANNIPVLITGEAGTGKRAAARHLHDATCRGEAALLRIHCAEVGEDALEEMLSPRSKSAGRARRAAETPGTLVLDGFERLSESVQLRLSEFLEASSLATDPAERVRVVAISTLSPQALAALPSIRRDLLYRLSVLPIGMPALRERRQDIPALAAEILRTAAVRQGLALPDISRDALDFLSEMEFPGNVSELEALLLGSLLSSEPGSAICATVLRSLIPSMHPQTRLDTADHSLDTDIEQAILSGKISLDKVNNRIYQTTIRLANGNVSRAARMLGLSRAQFAYRLGQAGMEAER
ncbi:MAG: sigma-54-dependent Fis family transcriptional regulator [Rhizobium sp.]|nr:sigma-54-dependent Fis family transcriptional regulator [Rhizobium sp.]